MPRKLRLEYPGAMYHVMSRGDQLGDSFLKELATSSMAHGAYLIWRWSSFLEFKAVGQWQMLCFMYPSEGLNL